MKTELTRVGSILLGNRVHVSDPCYAVDAWCAGDLENVLPGEYKCKLVRSPDSEFEPDTVSIVKSVKSMTICHKDYSITPREITELHLGIDSGQVGFFDFDYYSKNHVESGGEHCNREWYSLIGGLTHKKLENPKFIKRDEYIRQRLGERYIDSWELVLRRNNGTLSKTDFEELKKAHRDAWIEYETSVSMSSKYVDVGCGGTLDNMCFVASSGYSNGWCNCTVARNSNGQIVAARIKFI